MRRAGNLYESICAFQNLILASRRAQAAKRYRQEVLAFNYRLEENLITLEKELRSKSYRPGDHRDFVIFEPKRRLISAAPYRDRIVHHALCAIVEPIFDRSFIESSYANRRGKGSHRALNHCRRLIRRYRFCLRADIAQYFPTIDHNILKAQYCRKIRCANTLWLMETILDNSSQHEPVYTYFPGDTLFTPYERRKGLPIGNLTSQIWANVYLNSIDHAMASTYGGARYIRYVDDFALFSDDAEELKEAREKLRALAEELRLTLHPIKTMVVQTRHGVNFLGFRLFPTHTRLRQENLRRARRRFRKLQREYQHGQVSLQEVSASIQSWVNHAAQGNTWRLREHIFNHLEFAR